MLPLAIIDRIINSNIINKVFKPEIISWAIYLIFIIGFWCYQHYLITDTFAAYGVSELTIVCLLAIMLLLPFSISRRLKIALPLYSLSFMPSLLILALLANESIGIASITLAIILLALTAVALWRHFTPRYPAIMSNLLVWIVMLMGHFIIADTDEVRHYHHTINHYIAQADYDAALEVGKKSKSVDSTLFNQRSFAMMKQNKLSTSLFNYPLPAKPRLNLNMATTDEQLQELILCNLLLDKNLQSFVEVLKRYHAPQLSSPEATDKLPLHYREALCVYNSQSTTPITNNTESNVAVNYSDFTAERFKQTDSLINKRQCKRLYDNTYFYYYFYY